MMIRSDFYFMENTNIHESSLSVAYECSLFFSVAIAIPMLIDILLDAKYDVVATPQTKRFWEGRSIIVMTLIATNVALLYYNMNDKPAPELLVSVNYFRNVMYCGSILYCLHAAFEKVSWAVPRVALLIVLYSISQLFSIFSVLSTWSEVKHVGAIMYFFSLAGMIYVAAVWFRSLLKKKPYLRSLSPDETCYAIYFFALFFLVIGSYSLDLAYGTCMLNWPNFGPNQVSAYNYLVTAFVALISIVPGRYARMIAMSDNAMLQVKYKCQVSACRLYACTVKL
jgi:hypothetical protein